MVVTAPSPPKPRAPRDNRSIGQPALTHSCADDVRRATSDGIRHGGLAFSALALDVAVREALGLALFRSYAYHTGARPYGRSIGAAGTPPCRRRTCGSSRSRSRTSAQSAAVASQPLLTAHAPLCPPSVRRACRAEMSAPYEWTQRCGMAAHRVTLGC